MLKTITSNRAALNLFALALVAIGDGTGMVPDLIYCPTCGAAVLAILNLSPLKAGMPNGPTGRSSTTV